MRTSSVSHRLRALVEAYCCDSIAPADLKELDSLLRQDPQARQFFAAYCRMHSELLLSILADRAVQGADARREEVPVSRGDETGIVLFEPRRAVAGRTPAVTASGSRGFLHACGCAMARFRPVVSLSYLFSAALLGAALAMASLLPSARPGQPAAAAACTRSEPVGTITGMVDCRWGDPATATRSGAAVLAGQRFVLASGLLESPTSVGRKSSSKGRPSTR